ncbi:hypothetical protein ACJX0J_011963, partial [Zea mays]
ASMCVLLLFDYLVRRYGFLNWDPPSTSQIGSPSRPGSGLRGAATASSVSRDRELSPRLQRSRSSAGGGSKASLSPERRRGVGAMQQRVAQLEEELRREREEKARTVRDLEDLRRDGGAKGVADK